MAHFGNNSVRISTAVVVAASNNKPIIGVSPGAKVLSGGGQYLKIQYRNTVLIDTIHPFIVTLQNKLIIVLYRTVLQ